MVAHRKNFPRQKRGRARRARLARAAGPFGPEVSLRLGFQPGGAYAPVGGQMSVVDLQHALEAHPLAKAPQKLIALDLVEHADASRRDELIAQGIAQLKNGDANDLFALATWLNSKKEFEKTV